MAFELRFKLGVMKSFQKGITGSFQNSGVAKMGCKKICKIFASEFGFKLGVMRGFQKGITLGGRASGSVRKVFCGVGCWIIESPCLPTEAFRDISVTFL